MAEHDPVWEAAQDYWDAFYAWETAEERGDDDWRELRAEANAAWNRWHDLVKLETGQEPEGGP